MFVKSFLICLLMIMVALCSWQALVMVSQTPAYILPSPLAIFSALYTYKFVILKHALPTITAMLVGFFLGITLGMIAAITIASYRMMALTFLPLLIISQAIPTFAIAPLLVIWFGFGLFTKIITTTMMIFFPIVSNFYDGLQHTNPAWLDLASAMQAKKWRTFIFIRVPAALPALASGIRIAAVVAPIGAIVSEWVGSSEGLGYLMLNANARVQIDMMFAVLIVIIILALVLYFIVDNCLKRLVWW